MSDGKQMVEVFDTEGKLLRKISNISDAVDFFVSRASTEIKTQLKRKHLGTSYGGVINLPVKESGKLVGVLMIELSDMDVRYASKEALSEWYGY